MGKQKNKSNSASEEEVELSTENVSEETNSEVLHVDETNPGEVPKVEEVKPEKEVESGKIKTAEDAVKFVKENYSVPAGTQIVYVTEDCNVFWKENHSSALNHARQQKLKLYTIEWAAK